VSIEVSLREMLAAMCKYGDDETFRWYQLSHPGVEGVSQPKETLRVTVGQVRKELGLSVDVGAEPAEARADGE
jgi:hypothetical protein